MSLWDLLILSWASPVFGAFLCRLNLLQIGKHSFAVILMNWGFAGAVFAAGLHGFQATWDVQDVCILTAASAWIVTSLPTWSGDAAPKHVTKPMPLDGDDLERYVGGQG